MPDSTHETAWRRSARKRRFILGTLILIPSAVASSYVGSVLPNKGTTPLELTIVIVYSILFAWISVGFWTAIMGCFTLLRRHDRFTVSHALSDSPEQGDIPRTAVLFPICNEDTPRVMAGVKTTYLSLQRTPGAQQFDIHILSDSSGADKWVEEEAAWAQLVDELGAQGRIFYRNRKVNLKRKSGNVADFCRRHGRDYTYMAVFDADSVMTGETLNAMVRIMERRQKVGILQTAPACFGRDTLLGRLQQFANRVYGPMFAAGLSLLAVGRRPVLGPQRLDPHRAVHAPLRTAQAVGQAAAGRRHPQPRLCRGSAHAPRRMGRLARLRPGRQLGGMPAQSALRTQAGTAAGARAISSTCACCFPRGCSRPTESCFSTGP